MEGAAAKAPGSPNAFSPYLRAAIVYWRLQEEAARSAGSVKVEVEAVAERITAEDAFRDIAGRSFNTVIDAITLDEVLDLPDPA